MYLCHVCKTGIDQTCYWSDTLIFWYVNVLCALKGFSYANMVVYIIRLVPLLSSDLHYTQPCWTAFPISFQENVAISCWIGRNTLSLLFVHWNIREWVLNFTLVVCGLVKAMCMSCIQLLQTYNIRLHSFIGAPTKKNITPLYICRSICRHYIEMPTHWEE